MNHMVSVIFSIFTVSIISVGTETAWAQNITNVYEQELLIELAGIRNSLMDVNTSNTISSIAALVIGLILGAIAVFATLYQTSNLKKQLYAVERQVISVEKDSKIRMRPIVVRDVFKNGSLISQRKIYNEDHGRLVIKMINRGPSIAVNIKTRFECQKSLEDMQPIADFASISNDAVASLGLRSSSRI